MKLKGTLIIFVAGFILFCCLASVLAQTEAIQAQHVMVYQEPGRFAAWPANNGIWTWGNEILVGFDIGYFEDHSDEHSMDRSRGETFVLARTLDGGHSWQVEDPESFVGDGGDPQPVPGGIEFEHPGFALRVGKIGLTTKNGGVVFYSYDRGRSWNGPFQLPDFGGKELTARTDYLVNGPDECLLFLSADEPRVEAGLQDRAFTARTTNGGETFEFLSWMTGEPLSIRSVMPSTVRVSESELVSVLRRRLDLPEGERNSINFLDAYGSKDNGQSWVFLSRVAYTDLGQRNGNPPSLVRLSDGRLCVTYGYRHRPFGIRARLSQDNGRTWGPELVLRDDGRTFDLGYTRSVQRPDGRIVTIYYYTTEENPEQHIAATIWEPPAKR